MEANAGVSRVSKSLRYTGWNITGLQSTYFKNEIHICSPGGVGSNHPVEAVTRVMQVSHVARVTQVALVTTRAFPTKSNDRRLFTFIAWDAFMSHS